MAEKHGKLGELSYCIEIILIALGVALCAKAGLGVSSLVSPAYIIYLKMSAAGFDGFTFGMSEYLLQGFLLIVMCMIIRRFRWQYLLSFLTSVIYGLTLDGWRLIIGRDVLTSIPARAACFAAGAIITALAIAFIFRSYLPMQIYELVVYEVVKRYNLKLSLIKQIFDITMFAAAIILALALKIRILDGIGVGTIIITLVNSSLITLFGKLLDRFFSFEPDFPKLKGILG